MTKNEQIIKNEKILLEAFKNKDIKILEEILHDNVLFVLPNGITATKTMVIDNYRKGDTVMTSIVSTDQQINFADDTAIVSINLELKGNYFDHIIDTRFRYLRVWKLVNDSWKVIATSGVQLV